VSQPAVFKTRITDLIGTPGAVMLARNGLGIFFTLPCGHNAIGYQPVSHPGTYTMRGLRTCRICGWTGTLTEGAWFQRLADGAISTQRKSPPMTPLESHYSAAALTIAKAMVEADPACWGTWQQLHAEAVDDLTASRRRHLMHTATHILANLKANGFVPSYHPKESA